jgi:hypothetical protein
MALDKITSTMITDEAVTTAKLGPSAVTGAKIAADAIDITDLGTIMSVGETAPAGPFVGQRWFRLSTAITYQYTNDGTSSFWLDVSSGGIGTSAERGVDFVGDTDPIATTNGTGLAIGSVYYNREKNRHFVCTTATTNANVWSGRYNGTGGTVTDYTGYRIHTFTIDGTFILEDTTTCDVLIVAGGGGGAASNHAGGGGAGGFLYYNQKSLAEGSYSIGIGAKGVGGEPSVRTHTAGGDTTFTGLTTAVGGGRGGYEGSNASSMWNGGSGGGSASNVSGYLTGGAGTANQGNAGGNVPSTTSWQGAGGGGGAGGVGANGVTSGTANTGDGGDGGAGYAEGATVYNWTAGSGTTTFPAAFKVGSGSNLEYAGGGGGGGNGSGGSATHGGGAGSTGAGADATGYGGGGGGSARQAGAVDGGDGYQGVVIVRYAI